MQLLEALRFGAQALSLRAVATGSRQSLEHKQRLRLKRLVAHAKAHSPQLGDKYADIDPENFELIDLPTSNKAEVMEHFDQWLTVRDVTRTEVETFFEDESNLGKLFKDKYVVSHTSGSTGQPLLLVTRPEEFQLIFALQASRGHQETLDLKEVFTRFAEPVRLAAVTLKPGFYPSSSAFSYLPPAVRKFIEVSQLTMDDADLAQRLAEFQPTHLTTYASILHELARQQEAGTLELGDQLEQVTNISEKLMPKARRYYEQLFGAPVIDDYGMGECLFLTSGCLTSHGMHVNADWAIMEVVDENNQPVPAGERGDKILLTNLANYVQPFVRYEVTDSVVMASEPCECNMALPLIARVEGRASDVLYSRVDGEVRAFHPGEIEQVIDGSLQIREYQMVQQTPERLTIRVEPIADRQLSANDLQRRIEKCLEESNVHGVEVEVEIVDRLAGDEGGKFKRILNEVEPPKSS